MIFSRLQLPFLNGVVSGSLVGIALLLAAGCGKEENKPTTTELTPLQQVDLGWDYFAEHDYANALREFQGAIDRSPTLSNAWNGKGWALGKIPGSLDDAPICFSTALRLDTTRYDAIAGWAFAAYQLDDWAGALRKSDSLLVRRPGWRFLYEPTLDHKDMRLMVSAAYYNMGEFSRSYATIVDYLNPSFEADINTQAGRRELLDEIERLRRVNG